MRGRYVGRFIPFPRKERVYRVRRYENTEGVSRQALMRMDWLDWYRGHGENAALTCRHFGISRKTFYKWQGRFEVAGLRGLEDGSKAPRNRREPEISREEEIRIIQLRKKYLRYGKEKLAILYERIYGEKISAWKIYRVIRKHNLYWHPAWNEKLRKKRLWAEKRKKITELKDKVLEGLLFQMDTKAVWFPWCKRYIFTAVEKKLKLGFARMYKSCGSLSGRDFLFRLYLLVNKQLVYSHTDWGSEFGKYFDQECRRLGIQHYFSRAKTPNDHAEVERFNRTLKEEFLQLGNLVAEPDQFNPLLTEWLIEYNCNRPHEALGYLTPIEFISQTRAGKVLPMSPTDAYN